MRSLVLNSYFWVLFSLHQDVFAGTILIKTPWIRTNSAVFINDFHFLHALFINHLWLFVRQLIVLLLRRPISVHLLCRADKLVRESIRSLHRYWLVPLYHNRLYFFRFNPIFECFLQTFYDVFRAKILKLISQLLFLVRAQVFKVHPYRDASLVHDLKQKLVHRSIVGIQLLLFVQGTTLCFNDLRLRLTRNWSGRIVRWFCFQFHLKAGRIC